MDCMFSGETTTNEEHVLPRWMQRRFGLANQTYHLPNGTQIAYRNAKIPVSDAHNTTFGRIETRMAQGVATDQEIYLWAFKIHVGLIYKNAGLKVDIRAPDSPMFWSLDGFGNEIWLFRKLYEVWASGGSVSPNAFGSVIRMKALTPSPSFDFVHNLQTGVVFFQLGDEVIYVALYDQGRLATSNVPQQFEWARQRLSALPATEDITQAFYAQRVWACETSYFQYRSHQGINYVSTPTLFAAIPPMRWRDTRPSSEAELAVYCRSFGLKLERFNNGLGVAFSNLTSEEIRDLRER